MVVPESTINADTTQTAETLGIREILDADVDPVIDLLRRGFPSSRRYWEIGFGRLRARPVPPGMPRYGYMLEANGNAVGVVLLISSLRWVGDHQELFSNLSSWHVDPAYASHATQLFVRALTNKQTTFLSISPAAHVRPMMEALRFKRYAEGQVLAVPALARNRLTGRTRIVGADRLAESGLDERERRLLEQQAGYGCISLCCITDGQARPFVFLPRTIRGFIPCAHLVYCRNIAELAEVAGSVGRYLLARARPFVLIDANGPIPGLPGKYFPGATPKYYKGAQMPVLGDLLETEATIFGIWSPADDRGDD
jgi:hypothetical protein